MNEFLKNRWQEKANEETGETDTQIAEIESTGDEAMQRWLQIARGELDTKFENKRDREKSIESLLEITVWQKDPEVGRLFNLLKKQIEAYLVATSKVYTTVALSRSQPTPRNILLEEKAEEDRKHVHEEIIELVKALGKTKLLGSKWLRSIGDINKPAEFRDSVRDWVIKVYPEIHESSQRTENKSYQSRKQLV